MPQQKPTDGLQFVLASASLARRKLLQTAGLQPIVCKSDFDEASVRCEDPAELVSILAESKAKVVAAKYPDGLVLGCDSVLAFDGEIFGKPETPEAAIARWQQMRGNVGLLYTGHALLDVPARCKVVRYGVTRVYFAQLSDREIAAYAASGEPLNCAGSFALEGLGAAFIEKIEGCHSNVIGLSLPLLREMVAELGYCWTDLWPAHRFG